MLFRTKKKTIQLLKLLQNNMMSYYQRHTPPATNIASENWCLGSMNLLLGQGLFAGAILVFGRVCFKEMLRPSCIGFCWLANLKQDLDGCGLQAGRQLSAETGGFHNPRWVSCFFCWSFPVLSWFKVGASQFFHIFFQSWNFANKNPVANTPRCWEEWWNMFL